MLSPINYLTLCALLLFFNGCAVLHHVQLGDIDNRKGYRLKPFDIKVSETGFSIDEAARIAKAVSGKGAHQTIQDIQAIIGLFQWGPTTGKPVFTERYAVNMVNEIYKNCKSGRVTGVTSIREMRDYPVISGEIVKITGYCLVKR